MAARQRRCTWCGRPFVRRHSCDPAFVALVESTPKPRRRGNAGAVARNIVVTPLGLSMVSPAVRARIAERERTGS
jgi:hypothetical protein